MGERGPVPKGNAVRPSRGRAGRGGNSGNVASVPGDKPELPDGEHHPLTVEWWGNWNEDDAPQVAYFTATDWFRLKMLVPLYDAYWLKPTPQALAEIRQNETRLGATIADRLRLGWTITPPKDGEGGEDENPQGSRSRPDPRRKA